MEWSLDLIESAANQAGITEFTCIDMQTFSVVLGIYKRERLIVYGN
ncbi:MAG: TRL-like family protein [Desulfobacterales bacterium]|nr:TRL-like family protein [Desulfobacterales bacterium]